MFNANNYVLSVVTLQPEIPMPGISVCPQEDIYLFSGTSSAKDIFSLTM